MFWLEAEEFLRGTQLFECCVCYNERRLVHAAAIYVKYIGEGAEWQVQMEKHLREEIKASLLDLNVKITAGSTGLLPKVSKKAVRDPSKHFFESLQNMV